MVTYMPLQQIPAEGDDLWPLWQRKQSFGRDDGERNYVGGRGGTIFAQIIHNTRKEPLKDGKSRRKQCMCMIRLWNTFAVVRSHREAVAVKNCDLFKEIGQDTSCKEPG